MCGHPPGTRRPAWQRSSLRPEGRGGGEGIQLNRRPAWRSARNWNECLAFLRDGDALTVTQAGSAGTQRTTELLAIEADLSKRGVGLVVPSMGGEKPDTRKPTSKLMLTILAGVATWEREIMLERQREGIAKAKAAGKYKGRPISIDVAQVKLLRATLGPAAIAKRLGIARSSVYRVVGGSVA